MEQAVKQNHGREDDPMPLFENPDGSEYGVTMMSGRIVAGLQHTPEYQEDDSSAIYRMLHNSLKPIDFGYYLKRYLYRSAGYRKDFRDVSTDEYLATMSEAFSSGGVPHSLKPTTTRSRAAFKNWLTQKTVSREVVIMLGFGLDMSLEDINDFLTKALLESKLNPKDPTETVCWYCAKNHLGYYQFRRLLSEYENLPGSTESDEQIRTASTMLLRTRVDDIRNEKTLMKYLNQLRRIDGRSRQSVEARSLFMEMYGEACVIIADLKNSSEEENAEVELGRLKDRLSRDDRYDMEQKQERIRRFSEQKRQWSKEDITPVSFEETLFSAVPRDRNGNLLPMKGSSLNEQFRGKRLSRQHIQEILDGTGSISRYDLATMNFFVLSHRLDLEEDSVRRYRIFVDRTNAILDRCGMGKLYVANPYEAFLMICMLTDYPLGTYADVWEMSYEEEKR